MLYPNVAENREKWKQALMSLLIRIFVSSMKLPVLGLVYLPKAPSFKIIISGIWSLTYEVCRDTNIQSKILVFTKTTAVVIVR